MHKLKLTYLLVLLLFSFIIQAQNNEQVSNKLKIYAADLSEDMNRLSTQDDEMIILIYVKVDTGKSLDKPILATKFRLDTAGRTQIFESLNLTGPNYLIILMESDDNRDLEQIDPVIRVYWKEILNLCDKRYWNDLKKYLGDNDFLGYKNLSQEEIKQHKGFIIEGRQHLDHYLYKISIE